MLAAQGLLEQPSRGAAKPDVLDAIRRMGALQIDTIHVVARSPYLVLWSRLGDYDPRWLDELLAEGALFEQWSHEACLLPIEDYPLYRRLMLDGRHRARTWLQAHPADVDRVLAAIRERGAVRSAEFERTDGQSSGWWNWKPEKRALEMLHAAGDLMIARRHNFQRVYDLRERVLPSWHDSSAPPYEHARRALAAKAVRALGVATARWVPDYFRTAKEGAEALLEAMAEEGELVRTRVAGWKDQAYVHRDLLEVARQAASGELESRVTTLLSPFDPLVWDRGRVRTVFGFDYRIECYTPAPKRRYGYFTLPILHRGALVGRLDPKAHRRQGLFEVRSAHLEPGVPVSVELVDALADSIRACAAWHRTPEVVLGRSDPPELAGLLADRLAVGGSA